MVQNDYEMIYTDISVVIKGPEHHATTNDLSPKLRDYLTQIELGLG